LSQEGLQSLSYCGLNFKYQGLKLDHTNVRMSLNNVDSANVSLEQALDQYL